MPSSGNPLKELDSVPDRIRLHLQAVPAPVIITEGYSDRSILMEWLPCAEVFVANNRTSAVSALAELDGSIQQKICCVVDADFVPPEIPAGLEGQVAYYSGRDLESAYIRAGILERVLDRNLPNDGRVVAINSELRKIVRSLEPLSELRLTSYRLDLGLNFDRASFIPFVDTASWELDLEGYITRLCDNLRASSITPDHVRVNIMPIEDDLGPRGRDILKLAAELLKKNQKALRGSLVAVIENGLFISEWRDENLIANVTLMLSLDPAIECR